MREQFEAMHKAWPDNKMVAFMLQHGRDYAIGPHTFSLPRGEPKACFKNSTHLALELPHMTYVEGKVGVFGVLIEHAWCVDEEGVVVDPTLDRASTDGTFDRIGPYFGVPFRTDYLRKAILRNKSYGLLDIMCARETLPQLIELGLEAGQQWLMDGPAKKRRACK
jgi:hypothetical protein